jgi:hypothetical protein
MSEKGLHGSSLEQSGIVLPYEAPFYDDHLHLYSKRTDKRFTLKEGPLSRCVKLFRGAS